MSGASEIIHVPSSGAELSAELSPSELPDAVLLTFFFVVFFFSEPFPGFTFFLTLVPPTVHWKKKCAMAKNKTNKQQQKKNQKSVKLNQYLTYKTSHSKHPYLIIAVWCFRVSRCSRFAHRLLLLTWIDPLPLRQRQKLLESVWSHLMTF